MASKRSSHRAHFYVRELDARRLEELKAKLGTPEMPATTSAVMRSALKLLHEKMVKKA
jgi:hypothetical protein